MENQTLNEPIYCSKCGSQNVNSARFCQSCGSPTQSGSLTPPPIGNAVRVAPASQKRYAVGKSPATAVILSMLLVGLGQFYNGDTKKGILMMVVAIVGGILTHGIVAIVIYIWGWFDSHKVAKGKAPLWN